RNSAPTSRARDAGKMRHGRRKLRRPSCRQGSRMFDALVLQFLNGLDKGGAYALIALGLTLVFGTLGVVNFAHGALFMLGAFCAVAMQRLLTLSTPVKDESVTFFDAVKDVPYLEVWFGDAGRTIIGYSVPLSILLAIPVMLL